MARFTLIELHLEDAQFTANAPFAGRKSSSGSGKSIEERLGTETESTGGGSSSSAMTVLLGLVAVVGFAAVARRLLSGDGTSDEELETEEPLLAD